MAKTPNQPTRVESKEEQTPVTQSQVQAESVEQEAVEQTEPAKQVEPAPITTFAKAATAPISGKVVEPTLTTSQQILRSRLEDYVKAMAPAQPMNDENGARNQVGLYRIMMSLLRSDANTFKADMDHFLSVIKANRKGVFSERYCLRFVANMALADGDRRCFMALMNLFLTTCDPQSRQHTIKQIDMKQVIETISDESVRQRLLAYYS